MGSNRFIALPDIHSKRGQTFFAVAVQTVDNARRWPTCLCNDGLDATGMAGKSDLSDAGFLNHGAGRIQKFCSFICTLSTGLGENHN